MRQSLNITILYSIIIAQFAVTLPACLTQDTDSLLDYSRSAELLFLEAMDDFDDRDCVSAEPKFQDVRRKFPYSRYAVDASLRIADCQFIQDNHAAAAISYEQFITMHPTHEQADYAAFRRGECFVKQIPSNIFILPASHERDQSAARDARYALSQFIAKYPKSKWQDKASRLLSRVVDALVKHELYVAEFYLDRGDRLAAAVRLEKVRENFKESSIVPDAMFLQAMTYLKLDRNQDAVKVLEEIISFYPSHYQSKRASEYLMMLKRKGG